MGLKRLTVKGDSVEFAIEKGLKEIGLAQEQTFIQIIQNESDSIFGYRDAAVAITYDEEESKIATSDRRHKEFRQKFRFRFHKKHAQIQVPAVFYDDLYLTTDEERVEFLRQFAEEHGVSDTNDKALQGVVNDFQNQFNFVNIKTLTCDDIDEEGGSIYLNLSEDEMRCRAIFFPDGEVTEEQVVNHLKEKGIVRGLLRGNIRTVLDSKFVGFFDVARGVPAIDDQLGTIDKYFQEDEHKEFAKMIEELTIDTRSVKDINIADRNQLLMRIGDVVPGTDGYTVTGKILAHEEIGEDDKAVTLGECVYMSDDGKEVYSQKSGHIVWRPDDTFIDIEPVYIVEGNVDFSEGNIIGFVGKVIIQGDVKPKFSVVAEGDIEIHGSIEDATVRSTNGNVMVAGSIINRTEGAVGAKNTVQCNICTNANIKAHRILIEKEAMNSELVAEVEILAEGTPGTIIGGRVEANQFIRVNTIGSDRGVPTQILVGDVTELKKRLRTLNQKLTQSQSHLKEASQVLSILNTKQQAGELSESQQQQFDRTSDEVADLEDILDFSRREEDTLKTEIDNRRGARLEILKDIYREVDIRIFEGYFVPPTKESYTGFLCRKGRVQRYSL